MPSGITHILLSRNFQDQLPDNKLKKILAASKAFYQVGSVGPDLPYSSLFDIDLIFSDQRELADKMHYTTTNQIPLKALTKIKAIPSINLMRRREKRYKFAFFLGYIAHIIEDCLFHPFIRDKVGDYKGNETAHRILEMRIDVLLYHHFYNRTGAPGEFNYANIHDELLNIESYRQTNAVMKLFRDCINEVYNEDLDTETVQGWVVGLYRLFAVAEGEHPAIYRNLNISDGILYRNYDDLKNKADDILVLTKPKDREQNFLNANRVHLIDDCIPRFSQIFTPIAEKCYEYVYEDGPELTDADLSNTDLDTGRPVAEAQNLALTPTLWRDA